MSEGIKIALAVLAFGLYAVLCVWSLRRILRANRQDFDQFGFNDNGEEYPDDK